MKARGLAWMLVLLLGGCATYRPLPLNQNARALDNPDGIKVDASVLRLFPSRRHRFDPGHGLDMTDVAILAVTNNPQLKIARDERGVAHAQAFAAGLLPDPVLDLAHGTPTAGPSETSSFDLGLSYDVEALLTHPLAKRAANASARGVDLNLLWMEWQVIGAAHELFVRDVYQAKMLSVLREESDVLAKQHAQLVAVSGNGDVAQATVAEDLAGLQAVETRLHDTERHLLKTRQDLNALLGLSPNAPLHLVGPATVTTPSNAEVARALDALPRHRPDLLALQAGYRSADARYRQTILEQFPAIQIGFTRTRDADAIYTRGFQISLTLPIFNRNRGNIAITKATRKKLHDAYAVRVVQARAQVEQILQDQALLVRQRTQLQHAASFTSKTLGHLRTAALPGDISGVVLAQLQTNVFDRKLALLSIDEALLEQRTALQALLGATLPNDKRRRQQQPSAITGFRRQQVHMSALGQLDGGDGWPLLAGKRRFPPKTITSHVEPRNALSRRPNVSYVGTSLISVGERLIFAHQAGCAEQSFRRTQSDWTAAGEQPIDRVQNSQAARRRSSDASQDLCLSSRNLTDSRDNNSSGNSWTKPRSASGVT